VVDLPWVRRCEPDAVVHRVVDGTMLARRRPTARDVGSTGHPSGGWDRLKDVRAGTDGEE
jgi:hypothetical protein